MTAGIMSAFPVRQEAMEDGRITQHSERGMDIRTYMATKILCALVVRSDTIILTDEELSIKAHALADALLNELADALLNELP